MAKLTEGEARSKTIVEGNRAEDKRSGGFAFGALALAVLQMVGEQS